MERTFRRSLQAPGFALMSHVGADRGTHSTRRSVMQVNGACHCGSISFTAEIDPARVMICHCTDCQVLSGSPFRAVAVSSISDFHLRGTAKSYVKVAQSGNRRA